MAKVPFERLTSRHRDCLRLVAANHTTKEIAIQLGLSPNTIDGYISEAREILGAGSRRDAARLFQSFYLESTPQSLGGVLSRVDIDCKTRFGSGSETKGNSGIATSINFGLLGAQATAFPERDSFHWFRGSREHNSLSSRQRIFWIGSGSLFAAFMFVVAIASIDALARLLSH